MAAVVVGGGEVEDGSTFLMERQSTSIASSPYFVLNHGRSEIYIEWYI